MAPKNKWTLTLHDQVEDPYYTISNGPITLAANCGFVGETEEDEDAIFKMVAGALNDSGIDFHSENKLELQQHLKIQELEYENERLREALLIVQKWQLPPTGKFWDKEQTQPMSYGACYGSNGERDYMKAIANEALNNKNAATTTRPCPHCGKELNRDRNLCCRECGKEVEIVKEIEYMPIHPDDAEKFDCPTQFPMHLLNEEQAEKNHGQSLKRLKERGGLSVKEILAIVGKKNWGYYRDLQWKEAIGMLNDILTNPTK